MTLKKIPLIEPPNVLELYSKIRSQFYNTVLLESMDGPKQMATQSIIGFDPLHIIRIDDGSLYCDGRKIAEGYLDIVSALQNLIANYEVEQVKMNRNNPMFNGGLIGFTSYDFIRYYEEIPDDCKNKIQFPDGLYGLFLDGIVFDHVAGEAYYFHHSNAPNRFSDILMLIRSEMPQISDPFRITSNIQFSMSQDEFEKNVACIKDCIHNGEIFQAVLSQKASFFAHGDRIHLYLKLRELNPSPYMYLIEFHELAIIGSSPELLISLNNGVLTTYPIAGTRRIGKSENENLLLEADLIQDPKELAEHNMLVDLARNDLGKVAKIGTVKVPEYLTISRFSHVIHLVSKVEAKIENGLDQFDAFSSVFPAGTVSGAPKIRAMEIIQQLENDRRGPYAGAVGFFGLDGNMVQAIAIRTIFAIKNHFTAQAGAGIVHDSIPEKEYEETLNKMAAIFQAMREIEKPVANIIR